MASQICINLSSCGELLLGLACPFQSCLLSPSPGLSAERVLGQEQLYGFLPVLGKQEHHNTCRAHECFSL